MVLLRKAAAGGDRTVSVIVSTVLLMVVSRGCPCDQVHAVLPAGTAPKSSGGGGSQAAVKSLLDSLVSARV